jgi:hypothetical protein
MKRIILSFCIITMAVQFAFAQSKKAGRDSTAHIKFQKVVAAIEAKDFVIIVDTYVKQVGKVHSNGDKIIVREGGVEGKKEI